MGRTTKKGRTQEWQRGGGCDATLLSLMSIFAWNYRGLGSFLAVQNLIDAVKEMDSMLVFLSEKKVGVGRIKGIQNKLNFTQGIVVPSDGRSGGLALIWREGTEVFLKSCSHSHIDVVVRDGSMQNP